LEPVRQLGAGPLEQGAGGHRGLVLAVAADEPPAGAPPWLPDGAARRADEPVRPAQPLEVAGACVLVGEERLELFLGAGVVPAGDGPGRLGGLGGGWHVPAPRGAVGGSPL